MDQEEETALLLIPRNHWESLGLVLTLYVAGYIADCERPKLCSLSLLSWTRVTIKYQLAPITVLNKYFHLCDL